MRGSKRRHLTAPECQALAQSSEGLSPLRQPLSLGRGRGGGKRSLHPTHSTQRHPRAPSQQRNILDFFGIPNPQVQPAGMQSCGIKEEPLDPFSLGSPHSSSNSSLFLHSQDFVPAPRKRTLPAPSSGIPNPEQHLGEETEEKIPKVSGIKQEWEELEVEPLPDSHFGLLGTRNWEIPQGSMDDLPAEILRNIFAFLPVLDLYQNLSLVCHYWREIIRDPQFIPWKKLYHHYLRGEEGALQRVEQILQEFSITREQQGCVLGLVRLVASTGAKVDPGGVLQILGTHPLFPKAQLCVLNKFPDLHSKPGAEKLWAVVAVMVLFSGSVGDIRRLLGCFGSPQCRLGVQEVTEVLHCMATLLCAMRDRGIPICSRIHYNIFYCLSLMENASGIVQPLGEGRVNLGSSGGADVKLTHEQQRILNHKIEPGQTVKIMAFAGTGKTSTLVKYAEKFQELKFLYLTFNKSAAEKGKKVFPRNVTCKTFHSLAFGSIGRHYRDKGKLNFSKLSVYSISFLLQNRKGQSLFIRGKMVSQTLENFFSSSDEEICEEHTPLWFRNSNGQMELMSREEKRISVEEAKEIWHNMKQLDGDAEKRYKMTCDGTKSWKILGKNGIWAGKINILIIPALPEHPEREKSLFWNIAGNPIIPYRAYLFVDSQNFPADSGIFSVQSFRFGPEIAYVGSAILDVCKGIRGKTLLGGSQHGHVGGARLGSVALLSRSNLNVFEDAVELSGRDPPAKIHIIGVRPAPIPRISVNIPEKTGIFRKKLEFFITNLEIEDSFIKKWEESEGFVGLKEFALRVDDRDLQGKICIVERHRDSIPQLLSRIKGCHVGQEGLADFLMGTVHQAKGLEFDTVCVADDFVQIPSPVTGALLRRMNVALGRSAEDEWNLLYVAVTRAKRCLLLSRSLENLLTLAGERFLRVELLSEAGKDKDRAAVTCCVSGCTNSQEFSSGLVVKKLPLTHSDGSQDPGGFLCQACTQQFFGCLTPLICVPEIKEKHIQL
ncbi:PREDICTED: F-box DNA helicase 1 [Ficedula albicollis]|uniref:F-box DNA helicase 1 n=1 Tax=Ficedula albicollis TaxID=59894 RepID=UPI0007AD933E|nr:PREDICTED: F-box DNA helicase 1 [Ficedula albicollis]